MDPSNHGVRKVYHSVRKVYHGVRKVYHGVSKGYHGVRKVNLSTFQGQSNIRTVATVTHNRPTKEPREYRAFQIFQSIAGLGRIANLENGNEEMVLFSLLEQ